MISEVREAIELERRLCAGGVRLVITGVCLVGASPSRGVYSASVRPCAFDWTWDGATIKGLDDAWEGEVVGVDPAGPRLFIALDVASPPPSPGSATAWPMDFLGALVTFLQLGLGGATKAALVHGLGRSLEGCHGAATLSGEGHPVVERLWRHPWSILWGPPGTGKTWTICEHLFALMDGGDSGARLLVLSTTNQATDKIATGVARRLRAIAPAGTVDKFIVRIGKGGEAAAYEGFREVLDRRTLQLRDDLGTARELLAQAKDPEDKATINTEISELRRQLAERDEEIVLDSGVPIVVTTVHKATTLLAKQKIRERISDARSPFASVIIDEAGLVPRAAAAALSTLGAHRTMLVGDPHQLSPISRAERLLSFPRWAAQHSRGPCSLTDRTVAGRIPNVSVEVLHGAEGSGIPSVLQSRHRGASRAWREFHHLRA